MISTVYEMVSFAEMIREKMENFQKSCKIQILRYYSTFSYGNCFLLAVDQCFKTPHTEVVDMFPEIDFSDGVTTKECIYVIDKLCKLEGRQYKIENINRDFYSDYIHEAPTNEEYFLLHKIHVSFFRNGRTFDSFLWEGIIFYVQNLKEGQSDYFVEKKITII